MQKVKAKLDATRMTVTTKPFPGPVTDTLANYIDKSGADLLIMATHGRSGASRWMWGSIADKLLQSQFRIPIFLVRPPSCSIKK